MLPATFTEQRLQKTVKSVTGSATSVIFQDKKKNLIAERIMEEKQKIKEKIRIPMGILDKDIDAIASRIIEVET